MKCPYCGHNEDRVLDTREQKDGEAIRRRRECLKCKSRFSTVEALSLVFPYIVKKDGRREPYSREKVLKGFQAACQKRPISLSQLEASVDRITTWVINRGEKEIPSRLIGQKVMMELRLLDDVAYVRFARIRKTSKSSTRLLSSRSLRSARLRRLFRPERQRLLNRLFLLNNQKLLRLETIMRHQSRELALQILFQTEFAPQIEYAEFLEVFEQSFAQDVIDYADLLVNGVKEHREQIDNVIQSTAKNWKVGRMAIVDRNILRIAVFEMKLMPSPLKPNIAINEAVELAKRYSTTESASFVNGILDQVAKEL
jgi:transcriptional regulator NrdR/transcription antitermination factor NusB